MSSARACLQCLLKLFNFILAILGALMVVYSIWMLNAWGQESSPSPSPAPNFAFVTAQLPNLLAENASVADIRQIPAPGPAWFIYAFLGAGLFICIITLSGAVAAETHSVCCLSFYQFGIALMLLVQVVLAAGFFLDKSWYESILPEDPTGQLQKLRDFVVENFDIMKWMALSVLIVQLIAIGLAMILHAMHDSGAAAEPDIEDPEVVLVDPLHVGQTSSSQPYVELPVEDAPEETEGKKKRCSIM